MLNMPAIQDKAHSILAEIKAQSYDDLLFWAEFGGLIQLTAVNELNRRGGGENDTQGALKENGHRVH